MTYKQNKETKQNRKKNSRKIGNLGNQNYALINSNYYLQIQGEIFNLKNKISFEKSAKIQK